MRTAAAMTAFVLLVAGGLLWWKASPGPEVAPSAESVSVVENETLQTTAVMSESSEVSPAGDAQPLRDDATGPQVSAEPMPEIRVNREAVTSLRRGREEGEPRMPPLAEDSPERELPTEEELADPDMYLEYEARQKQNVLASFLQASEKKVTELREAIQRAEAEGLPPEQLAEGREKLKRLEAMREEILRDHPSLSAPEDGQPSPASP